MARAEVVLRLVRLRREYAKLIGLRLRKRPLPRQLPPKAIEVAYYRALGSVLQRARALVRERLVPRLEAWEREARTWRGDAASGEVGEVADALAKAFAAEYSPARLKAVAAEFGKRTSEYQRTQFNKQARAALGVDVLAAEPWLAPKLETWAAENVALIKSIPQRYFSEVEAAVLRGVNAGTRPESIAADLEERFGVAEDRAALVARDQTNKLFGDLNRQRQGDLGVSAFIWRTSNDERVRESHRELEGERFEWSDPPLVDGEPSIPGSPIQCRCVAEPDFTGVLDDS
jgi:SPP1 gp7 family putative phage head morphogenesis protein